MKRIQINEQHIRKIVKETLENLILGEEPNEGISLSDIKNMKLGGVEDINIENEYEGSITLYFTKPFMGNDVEFNEDVYVTIYFEIIGDFEKYNAGDYFTEPSGGGFNLEKVIPNHVSIDTEDGENPFELSRMQPEFKFFYDLLNKFSGEIERKCMETLEYEEEDNSSY